MHSAAAPAKKQVKSFDYVPKVKDDVISFVRHFSVLDELMKKELKPFAEVEFKEKSTGRDTSSVVIAVKPAMKVNVPVDIYNRFYRLDCQTMVSIKIITSSWIRSMMSEMILLTLTVSKEVL